MSAPRGELLVAAQRGLGRIENLVHPEGDVLDPAIDEETGRAPHVAAPAAIDVLANSLQVDVFVEFGDEERDVESKLFRLTAQVLTVQLRLMSEYEAVD